MQTNSIGYGQANVNALQNTTVHENGEKVGKGEPQKSEETSIEEQMNNAAVEVAISMNAQIVLFAMDASKLAKDSTAVQSGILDFLSGKKVEGMLSLEDLGYTGKPITELSADEASDLIGENGFFGVTQTSDRVAGFVFNFSGDDLEKLEKGRKGIVQGFAEAEKLWGGQLPEISYETQKRTLELIDARIAELKGGSSQTSETE